MGAYFSFDRVRLKALFTYGGGLQVIGIAQMLFEPIIKVLLNHFGGIALTGYFDMANKILLQFRSLLVAGYNAIVPHVAARSAGGDYDREVAATYRHSLGLLLFVLLPYGVVAAAGIPLALTVWKGTFDPTFVQVTLAMHIGWLLNSLNPPSYLIYVALGRLRWNMVSQLATGLFMVTAGPLIGHFFGGPGVLACAMAALALGSIVVIVVFHHEFAIRLADFIKPARVVALGLTAAAMAASWHLTTGGRPGLPVLLALPVVAGALAAVAMVRSHARRGSGPLGQIGEALNNGTGGHSRGALC
jgi:O-antigen/teichoic acid export membrane protein